MSLGSSTCRYFLARQSGPMAVELVDGCHGDPEGVARAAKLLGRIFSDEGPWLMVEIHPMPDMDPPINEGAADACAALVRHPLGTSGATDTKDED